MAKDPVTGALEPKPGYLAEVVTQMPEFMNPDMPDTDIIEYDPLLDSSNIGPCDWSTLARHVGEHYYDYDGFVIVHGTDTMAYTGAALSFMLQGLGKPVILTGSIIPMCEVYSDARRNLIISVMFAARLDLAEVTIFFNDVMLRANRAMKVDSSGLAAFDSPNFPPLASVGATITTARSLWRPPPAGRLRVHTQLDARVVVVRLSPGFDDGALVSMVRGAPELKGLVLSLYGTGNGPSYKESFMQLVRDTSARGVVVVAVSQCPKGSVSLATYEVGRLLLELGVVSAGDMTTEACVTKLAYLCGRGLADGALREAMMTDLRGERSVDFSNNVAGMDSGQSRSRPVRLASL